MEHITRLNIGLTCEFVSLCAGQMVLLAKKTEADELPAEKAGVTTSTGPQVYLYRL